ncbi:LysR family transcriptional regulator [Actinorhabdospora filicis]|uniref:LysR family transcriptional regulator n=1 Tax=Actinorhabdospora filicis TaxID=1785913 RepID=UPI002555A835|nr:LysR family transcriptional regulator [Actinorhabdospora filicis]
MAYRSLDNDELRAFLVLADHLHFGRTAETLMLSRARVSQLIAKLERRVGGTLFDRTSRSVALSPLGQTLRAGLEPHYRGLENALAAATAAAKGVHGRLMVGFVNSLAGELALRAAEELRAAHPGLDVELCEVPMADPFGQLRSGEYDIALTEFPVLEPDLGTGPELMLEGRVLAVHTGHPLTLGGAIGMESLGDVPLLPLVGPVPPYRLAAAAPERTPSGRTVERGPAITNMQEGLMLVAAGKGALLLPAHAAEYHARPGVAYVPVHDAEPVRYGVIWRAGEESAAARAFAALAAEVTVGAPV